METEIEVPKGLGLTEEQIKHLHEKLTPELVGTAKGALGEPVTAQKAVEESEVVKVKRKVKVTE